MFLYIYTSANIWSQLCYIFGLTEIIYCVNVCKNVRKVVRINNFRNFSVYFRAPRTKLELKSLQRVKKKHLSNLIQGVVVVQHFSASASDL